METLIENIKSDPFNLVNELKASKIEDLIKYAADKYYNTDYRIAVVTFVSIVYLGCALNHIREAVFHKNFNIQNIGPSFINDVVTPIVLLLTLD